MATYRDCITHEVVSVPTVITKYINGEARYFDKYHKPLINPKTGNLLEMIEPEGSINIVVFTDTASRYSKMSSELKQRAKIHAQTSDQKFLKKQAIDRELYGKK